MKNISFYSLLLMTGIWLSSCDADQVDNVDFDVTLAGNTQEIYVGDAVNFNFTGNPDYIVFYSGEEGSKYANKDRLKVDVESAELSYTIKQQYTKPSFFNMEAMSIYISEDFNSDYSTTGLDKATWLKLSGQEEGQLKVPFPTKDETIFVSDKMDFSAYKDKKFYLAFQYHLPAAVAEGKTTTHPRVDVLPLVLTKTLADGSTAILNNPKAAFGFSFVYVKVQKEANFSAGDASLLFQPGDYNFTSTNAALEVDVWSISQQIDLTAVSPDMGTPIKSLNMTADSYMYTYTQPGEYTATFVAQNANEWNSKSVVREMKIVVKAKLAE